MKTLATPENFLIEGIVKPGARFNQILTSTTDPRNLSANDFAVLIGGSNDVYHNETAAATSALKTTLGKLTNTNVIVLKIPQRYDLMELSCVNTEISRANKTFETVCRQFKNVTIIDINDCIACNHSSRSNCNCQRACHTRHGQHLSGLGKTLLAQKILNVINHKVTCCSPSEYTTKHTQVDQGNVLA